MARLGNFDVDVFAMKYYLRKIMKKAMLSIRIYTFENIIKAKKFYQTKMKQKSFLVLKRLGIRRIKSKRVDKKIDEIY
jgi:hypothetical protein